VEPLKNKIIYRLNYFISLGGGVEGVEPLGGEEAKPLKNKIIYRLNYFISLGCGLGPKRG
jgi:hypothetical protein